MPQLGHAHSSTQEDSEEEPLAGQCVPTALQGQTGSRGHSSKDGLMYRYCRLGIRSEQ